MPLNHDLPRLRLGVAGLGSAFLGMHSTITTHPCLKVVAAADSRKEARDTFAEEFGARTYKTVEDLCHDEEIDLIYIATPHQFHAEHAIMAARHGKHVILEKPIALTIGDCQTIIEEVDKAGIKFIVGHTNSYDPPVLKMREVVCSGVLGELRMIHAFNYQTFLYRPRRPEELNTALGGGILFNQVPHQVDMVRLIGGGTVRSVRAYTGVWDPDRPTEGSLAAFIDFENKVAATIVYSGYGHFDSEEFLGRAPEWSRYGVERKLIRSLASRAEEAALKEALGYGGSKQKSWARSTEEHEHFGVIIVSCDKGDMRVSANGITIYGDTEICEVRVPAGRGKGPRANVIDELYDAVIFDKPPLHDARWGMATLQVCLALLESARERREIFLSHTGP